MFYKLQKIVFILCTRNGKSPPKKCDEINNPEKYNVNRLKKITLF